MFFKISRTYIFSLFAVCLLWANSSFAQQNVSFRLQLAQDSVRLGQPLIINVQLALPAGGSLRAIDIHLDSLKVLQGLSGTEDSSQIAYEIIDHGSWSPAKNNRFFPRQLKWEAQNSTNGQALFQNNLKVIIWEPGIFLLPAAKAEVDLKQGAYDIFSNENTFIVGIPNQDQLSGLDSTGLAPIKSIIREPAKNILWKAAAVFFGLLFLGLITYYFFNKRKSEPEIEIITPVPAHEKALLALADIEARGDWNKGLLKKYYDELTHVLRSYLEDRYEIKALESTSDEILGDLRKDEIDDNWMEGLKKLLPMTDLVKFAKAEPYEEQHLNWLSWARSMIESTKKIELEENENENAKIEP